MAVAEEGTSDNPLSDSKRISEGECEDSGGLLKDGNLMLKTSFDLSGLGGSSSTVINHLDLVVGTDIGSDL
ncbi:hypothetical protein L484_026517 [Morus notabilis]|uniref:Uncharacterized protein n=1 Tax=Morus notabilis TaxID=981085 RepID=W9QZ29_9ROSA|nr:hypothetical protein L484_026517 [Morus notabilis]